jgi:hypothetical protein
MKSHIMLMERQVMLSGLTNQRGPRRASSEASSEKRPCLDASLMTRRDLLWLITPF